ncbi:META domain-containing protein [Candidatus Thiodictyon syntrophicum]|jgi:heat shock protein HslJ|uniref:Heat-shock protein n=1 Tax=Candidatus Thiodictyon syntrophicum TaxID=1166950 RepID=A0A2K8U2X9_9GAMM|nr:META domain-containing protein [Candidatus Thiodictyon syntrophicum]AUB79946.1 heat-shock protein [Candidatus Thiodictyon syntrophicum]
MKHSPPAAAPALLLVAALLAAVTPLQAGPDRPAVGNAAAPPASPAAAAAPAPQDAGEPATGAPPSLENTSWSPAAYRAGKALVEIAAGPRPGRFRFEAGRVAGTAGCNQIGGSYTLAGASLTFKANMASTMMACPEPLMKQDKAVGLALTRVAAYRLDGELLELLDAAGAVQLRFVRLKPTPLVGQVWQLTGYDNGKEAISSARNGTEINLEFRDDGTLGGSDGCNRYMSGYTLSGATLTIGPLASTRMACKPDGAAQQARDYAAALGSVTSYRIEGGELLLLTGEGKPAARYRTEVVRPVEVEVAAGGGALPSGTPDTAQTPQPALTAPATSTAPQGGAVGGGEAPRRSLPPTPTP